MKATSKWQRLVHKVKKDFSQIFQKRKGLSRLVDSVAAFLPKIPLRKYYSDQDSVSDTNVPVQITKLSGSQTDADNYFSPVANRHLLGAGFTLSRQSLTYRGRTLHITKTIYTLK